MRHLHLDLPRLAGAFLVASAPAAGAEEAPRLQMNQVLVGSLDQPKARALLRDADGAALSAPGVGDLFGSGGETTYFVEGFYDTGAGTVLLGPTTARSFGLDTVPGATFADVGVGGLDFFDISETFSLELADYDSAIAGDLDDPTRFASTYLHRFEDLRAAVGPRGDASPGAPRDPIDDLIGSLSEFNVFGTPLMKDKLAVFDSRGLNGLFEAPGADPREIRAFTSLIDPESLSGLGDLQLKTHIYGSPNAPGGRGGQSVVRGPSQPELPTWDARIATDYADFDALTITTGGEPPALAHNPFVGPAPALADEDPDDGGEAVRGVTINTHGVSSEGSWLFDTGAAATIWSAKSAAAHGVFYSTEAGKELGSADPTLVDAAGNEIGAGGNGQFQLQVGGVGGTLNIAGFFVDELLVPALRDDGAGGEEAFDLVFTDAPVLVADISIDATPDDETDDEVFTLAGVFGMNLLVPSLYIDGLGLNPSALGGAPVVNGNFDAFAFDEPTGDVLLRFNRDLVAVTEVPEPAAAATLLLGIAAGLRRRRGTGPAGRATRRQSTRTSTHTSR
ncbi:hypothetical protein [Phycisphaera mikurensis]|uniref:Uncharacterized protein n=1 Tax=Phycisphaera mikurensis (strain NBRC 102666 / KCTC 22515 / FYK2301M01) TaxID=1142394 RepID=I0ID20_PHYMF|nr:hypothetical protein [Phycisphaera mikurensis]MBB6442283.1 hypothetical protein [Phycisphaera mikurensis]BAM03158.1 hypothetical protein PSMK_09990 [Phycisphaera mikurensis NBRC 102666]